MANNQESGSIDNVVTGVIESIKANVASVSTGMHVAIAELRVALNHAGLVVCLAIVASGMVLVGWGLLLVLGAIVLMQIGMSIAIALMSVFVINLLAVVVIGMTIRKALDQVSFKHTRDALTSDASASGQMSQVGS